MDPNETHVAAFAVSAKALSGAALELVAFADGEPALASRAGVEVLALEARGIMSAGAPMRLAAKEAAPGDMEALARLEGIVTLAEARLDALDASLGATESGGGIERLSGFIGIASPSEATK